MLVTWVRGVVVCHDAHKIVFWNSLGAGDAPAARFRTLPLSRDYVFSLRLFSSLSLYLSFVHSADHGEWLIIARGTTMRSAIIDGEKEMLRIGF